MTLLQLCLWSGVAATAIGAMIAHYRWGELRKDLATAVGLLEDRTRQVDIYKGRWNTVKTSREFFKGHAIAGTKTIAALAKELIDGEKRAKLHCSMIEDQRARADGLWEILNAILTETADMAVAFRLVRREYAKVIQGRITWSTCPVCGRLVAATGTPYPIGSCRHCHYMFTGSEICEVDPIKQESDLIETVWNLYTRGRELHRELTARPRICLEITQREARLGHALTATEKAFPDIVNPPESRTACGVARRGREGRPDGATDKAHGQPNSPTPRSQTGRSSAGESLNGHDDETRDTASGNDRARKAAEGAVYNATIKGELPGEKAE